MKLRFDKTMEGCYPIEGKSVIDIGCGPGHYSVTLAKMGAEYVYGIDFAKGMIDLARKHAEQAGVGNKCKFVLGDFITSSLNNKLDYSIVMGFMDYVEKPGELIERVLSITKSKAFFSFPVDNGFLAWQRKLRYKKRCDLFMYNREQLNNLFSSVSCKEVEIEKVSRDFFVTVLL